MFQASIPSQGLVFLLFLLTYLVFIFFKYFIPKILPFHRACFRNLQIRVRSQSKIIDMTPLSVLNKSSRPLITNSDYFVEVELCGKKVYPSPIDTGSRSCRNNNEKLYQINAGARICQT